MNYLTRLLLILVLAVALLAPTSDMAEFQEGDYRYTVDNDEATVTKYEGPGGDVTIPATLGEHPVRIIGSQAFSDNTTINSVVIPDSVTTIADLFMFEGAFSGCTSLESVTLGDSVETIGNARSPAAPPWPV